ncbi:hydroxypyruvate isomerase [Arsenicitalea aurantiaca]|uniref:Hydroxypyruvate isomerase n=1 Tax=Arsenicitalea aurantiaca TaxID=1783274 RepID=A0A433XBJ6_9HYPH|nr:TIM barrel protein [Arsenicitalea aurantiaca]RUT31400.1 hydroxypyruvate isomerase [Arsenicitalea aurantiaca]
MRLSACLEMLFVPESADFLPRIALAHEAGFRHFEFWRWTNKSIEGIEAMLESTGMSVAGLLAEPTIPLTDRDNHERFLAGLDQGIAIASRLGAPMLIAQAGNGLEGESREAQADALVDCLRAAADRLAGTGIVLALEPLNTRLDHPGHFLFSTTEGLDLVDRVGRPEIRLLYDIYHSAMMGERMEEVLAGRIDRIAHVHLADAPGRHEPGSGEIDWRAALAFLDSAGYGGLVGLEYRPTGSTIESLRPFLPTPAPAA